MTSKTAELAAAKDAGLAHTLSDKANHQNTFSRCLFIGGGHYSWGMEQVLLTLQGALVARGISCKHVISGWGDGKFAQVLTARGIEAGAVEHWS